MSANDAFTAGVRPGGLTSSTEIRLLLCYLVKNAGPITRQEIENALMEEALVNYFEIGSCLDDISKQALVTLTGDSYTITDKGRKVAQELAYDLPRSVRERAVAAVLRCQTWARKEAKYSARHHRKGRRPLHRALHRKGAGQRAVLSGAGCARPAERRAGEKAVYPEGQRDLSASDQQADRGRKIRQNDPRPL